MNTAEAVNLASRRLPRQVVWSVVGLSVLPTPLAVARARRRSRALRTREGPWADVELCFSVCAASRLTRDEGMDLER